VTGAGRRLFEGVSPTVPLTLLESRRHRNGVVSLRYAPTG
jgi:hypothetical protein